MCRPSIRVLSRLHLATAPGLLLLLALAMPAPSGAQPESRDIQWFGRTLRTDAPRLEGLPATLRLDRYPPTVTRGYYLVQFDGAVDAPLRRSLQDLGVEFVRAVPQDAWLVRMNPARFAEVRQIDAVTWADLYQPGLRLSRGLQDRMEGRVPDYARRRPPARTVPVPGETVSVADDTTAVPPDSGPPAVPDTLRVVVRVFDGEDLSALSDAVEDAGAEILSTVDRGGRRRLVVRIPVGRLADLARVNGVYRIEEWVTPTLDNDVAVTITGVEEVQTRYGLPFGGRGQIIAIADTGLDGGSEGGGAMHPDFRDRIVSIESWPVQSYDICPSPGDCYPPLNAGADDGAADVASGHGTHVTGSALSDGTMSSGVYRGVAHEATLYLQAIEQYVDLTGSSRDGYYLQGIPLDLTELFQSAYDAGARIHSDSWGAAVDGAYTTLAEDLDAFVWDHPDMLVLASAGNSAADHDGDGKIDPGSVTSPGSAKNCLTVGASENDRATVASTYGLAYGAIFGSTANADRTADDPDGIAAFSGRGPTEDGRIKPDLVAPGTFVISTRSRHAGATYFADDMESGETGWVKGGGWDRVNAGAHTGSWTWHDSPAGSYATDADASLTMDALDLSGAEGEVWLMIWAAGDFGSGDEFRIELDRASTAGVDAYFPNIESYLAVGGSWTLLRIPLTDFVAGTTPASRADMDINFRIIANGDASVGDGLYIDDVMIMEDDAIGLGLLNWHVLAGAGDDVDSSYFFNGGTSMATPHVAGAAAVVRQYYEDIVGLDYVSAALVRATLTNGAQDLQPGEYAALPQIAGHPDDSQGWGRLDLERSLFPASPSLLDFVDRTDGIAQGDVHSYELAIADKSVPLAVTLVYHDYPGAGLVNDIDLAITAPDGTVYHPRGAAGPDAVNNVEQIVVPAASLTSATYTLTVAGRSVSQGPQPYALVTRAGGTMRARQPVDIGLVLDKSGSMAAPACPSGCASRWEVLTDAVELFGAVWGAVTDAEDRIALTYFDTTVDQFMSGGEPLVNVQSSLSSLMSDVRAKSPSQLTAMGGGLQTTIGVLGDDTRPRHIVLFSDGMQNVNPKVRRIEDGADFHLEISDDPDTPTSSGVAPTSPATRLDGQLGITVSAVAIGSTDDYLQRLEEIAAATGGLSRFTPAPDDDLRRFFVEELVHVLGAYSPQIAARRRGTVGNDQQAIENVVVNATPTRIVFSLDHVRGGDLQLWISKGGVDVTGLMHETKGKFYRVLALDLPAAAPGAATVLPGGQWKATIVGKPGTAYDLTVIVDDPVLKYGVTVGGAQTRASEPLQLGVRLTWAGRPVTDASSVTARVIGPGQSIGNLLSTNATPAIPPGYVFEPNSTPVQQKLELLLQQPEHFGSLMASPFDVRLSSNGDGTYSGSYARTDEPGTYRVEFEIAGDHPDLGQYRRFESVTTVVEFGRAVLDRSDLRFTRIDPSGTLDRVQLEFRPRDARGNYLGPAYGHRIDVAVQGPGSPDVGSIEDLADGTYRVPIRFPEGSDPVVRIEVLDAPLYEGPLSAISRPGRFAVSFHAGATLPLDELDRTYDPGVLLEADASMRVLPHLAVLAVLGSYQFETDYRISGATLYGRVMGTQRRWTLFAEAGVGGFWPDGQDAHLGVSGGVGVSRPIRPRWSLELAGDYYRVFTPSDDLDWIGTRLGLVYDF